MKEIPSGLAGHLAGKVTTLVHCWIVTRSDGVRLGFTDHDRPIEVDGLACLAENGFEATALASGPGLATGGGEVSGALSSPALSDDELEAGYWDGATADVYLVNWADPAQALLLRRAQIGEVSRKGEAFQAEVRGLAHKLEVKQGRVFAQTCDADLGDKRCKVTLESGPYLAEATVASVDGQAGNEPGELIAAGLSDYASGWFSGGRFEVLDGTEAGFRSEIAAHLVEGNDVRLSLWQAPPTPLAIGTAIRVIAGCDKRFSTCVAKFSNSVNFQGFPHMPGTDFVLSYPTRNTGENDGSALVS
ncbi:DUF2163 domain-containing protein [Roseibium algae]|uniref:DUF2163 domain-containing protein n=1 Tax=Roseibium algae TaxID=3123038 RepID=A0ABU8TIG8_9HYPH